MVMVATMLLILDVPVPQARLRHRGTWHRRPDLERRGRAGVAWSVPGLCGRRRANSTL